MDDNSAKWMEQSYYEGIPHSEVNWAELAQNWMAMQMARSREGNSDESSAIPPPPPPVQRNCPQIDMTLPPSNPQFIPPIPFFPPVPMDPSAFGNPSAGWAPPPPGSLPPGPGPFPPFIPPQPPWANPPGGTFRPSSSINASSFPHQEGNEKEGTNLAEYYEKWDDKQKMEQKQYDSENEDASGIPQGAMAHWLAPPNHWAPPGNWVRRGQDGSSMDMPFIDQRTRKALPAWIREGLEKAEKEKQKKLEKEMKMRVAEEAAKARRLSKGLGKFDSDSSDEESDKKEADQTANGFQRDGDPIFLHGKLSSKKSFFEKNGGHHIVKVEEVDLRTEEEKREDALLLLRRFMTDILLTTTDAELERIAADVIESAKRKNAQPKILAKSSALAALSSLGTESDEDSDDGNDRSGGEKGQNGGADGDDERTPSPKTSSCVELPNSSDDIFKTPLPIRQNGAKSKSKLSRNDDDGNSATEIPKGSDKVSSNGTNEESANVDDNSSSSVVGVIRNSDEEKPEFGRTRKRSRSRSQGRISISPKRRNKRRSRSKERRNGSSYRSRSKSSEDRRRNGRQGTPERYHRRSRSRGRKHSHRSSKGRSRSPDRHGRRPHGRKRSRSRNRRSSSKDRHSRSRERRSRSRERRSRSRGRRSRSRERRSRSRERRSRSRERRRSRSRGEYRGHSYRSDS